MYQGKLTFVIKSSPEKVYGLLFDIKNWSQLLPHCEQVDIEKNTNSEQIAIMIIKNGNHIERIRTIRNFEKDKWITFNQSPPPPLFSIHNGKWTLKKIPSGTSVEVIHNIEIKKRIFASLIEYIVWLFFLKGNSLTTLRKIKERLE
jgi:aromatase